MQTPKAFDPYELIGIITPGVVLTLVLAIEAEQFRELLGVDGFGVGDLGLFLIVAFVLGHLVQAIGNLLDLMVWPIGGLPTNRVRFPKQNLVTERQRDTLAERVSIMEGLNIPLENYSSAAWRAVMTRAYARVRNANRSIRIDIANRTYGLSRGLAAALAICLCWYGLQHREQQDALILLALMLAAAIWRMRRAGIHYARALIQEFIDLPTSELPPVRQP